MAETPFESLSVRDRREALNAAQQTSGRRAFLLEKDVWIVGMLRALFGAPFGADLVFKGGTSLAKAYHAIRRFSEDIDVTYDIRAFAPDLVTGAGAEALPSTRSQEKRWSRAIRSRLAEWVRGEALAAVGEGLGRPGLSGEVSASGERLVLRYEPLLDAYGFVRPEVIVEFGASPSVMMAERTLTTGRVASRCSLRRIIRVGPDWGHSDHIEASALRPVKPGVLARVAMTACAPERLAGERACRRGDAYGQGASGTSQTRCSMSLDGARWSLGGRLQVYQGRGQGTHLSIEDSAMLYHTAMRTPRPSHRGARTSRRRTCVPPLVRSDVYFGGLVLRPVAPRPRTPYELLRKVQEGFQ